MRSCALDASRTRDDLRRYFCSGAAARAVIVPITRNNCKRKPPAAEIAPRRDGETLIARSFLLFPADAPPDAESVSLSLCVARPERHEVAKPRNE